MFRNKLFRMALVVTILVALFAVPMAAGAQMENGLNVEDGAVVSGTVDITGYADAPDFAKWDLYVFPGGDENAKIFLANGTDAGEFSATVDTTNFPDGDHVLSLRVVDGRTGNYQEYLVPFTIANAEAAPAEAAAETPAAEASSTMTETVAMTETVEAPAAVAEESAAPVNGFDLEDGVEVSGTVTVTGYADTVGFTKWQLDVIPFGNTDDAIFLAVGEDSGAFSEMVDTTNYPDGDHQLRLRVVDNTGNYQEYFADVTVANGGAEAAPAEVAATPAVTETATTTATVAAPEATAAPAETTAMTNGLDVEEGATVSGTVDITGYAAGDNFKRWDLHVFPGGDDNAKIWIASGSEPGEFSVSIDTTQFPDGDHVLSLRVVDATTGNYQEYLVPFTIANAEAA